MPEKIQLLHPQGKKAVSMDLDKYELLQSHMLACLKKAVKLSQAEILKCIEEEIARKKIKFEGSVQWHLEWVKLDLEARMKIRRNDNDSPIKYSIV
jgi:hypothetical protein